MSRNNLGAERPSSRPQGGRVPRKGGCLGSRGPREKRTRLGEFGGRVGVMVGVRGKGDVPRERSLFQARSGWGAMAVTI
jgi:hypothetical protein